MNPDKLLILLSAWRQPELDGIARESAQSAGSTYLRERLTIIAERCCRDYPGDLVEIGCLNGSTTVRLCQVAKEHGRRVIAVDPYAEGTQNCTGAELPRFLAAIEPYQGIVDFVREDSRSAAVRAYLSGRELAFSFVDGLHTYEAALNDVMACGHSGLIAVDDITWNSGVKRAWFEGADGLSRLKVEYSPLHEAYIL